VSTDNGATETIDGTAEELPTVPNVGALIPTGGAKLAVAPQVQTSDLVERLDAIKQAQADAMVKDTDYGVIPGTGKPTLLKPGAEKLSVLFQLDVQIVNEKIWGPDDHLTVIARATAFHAPTGTRLGYGEGLCTTREKKYGKRKQDRACPACGKDTIKKSKYPPRGAPEGTDPGWYCYSKLGGCGAEFAADDQKIISQPLGEIENPDIPDTWNTVIKMAEKRARVDVVLAVTGASALFTQDVEDGQSSPDQEAAVAQAQTAAPQTTARERKPSERPITGAQKGKINALLAEAGASPEEASAIRVWWCAGAGCSHFDRLPSKSASDLIETLGAGATGISTILDSLKVAAGQGNEVAQQILARMEGTDA
jgi:hypothetical protein